MDIKKELRDRGEELKTEEEGLIEGSVRIGEEKWRIIGVYVKDNIEKYRGRLEKWMEKKKEGEKVILGGDFNARIGREGGARRREENYRSGDWKSRRSKDGKINKEGRKLVEMIEERGWSIWNGNIAGDEEGEFTFMGDMGSTVIDYVIGDEETKERIRKMRIGDKVDSDHHPLEIWRQKGGHLRPSRRRKGKTKESGRITWDVEGREKFREKMRIESREERGLEEEWREMKEVIKGIEELKEVEEEQNKEKKRRGG